MKYIAGNNVPGFLPDCEPVEFDTFEEAKRYIIGMMKSYEETTIEEWEATDYSLAAEDVNLESGPFTIRAGEFKFWVEEA